MPIDNSKFPVDEASLMYQGRTALVTMGLQIAAVRDLTKVFALINRAAKVRFWLKALDQTAFLTYQQRQQIWYKLIEISGIYNFPTSPVLNYNTRPNILINAPGGSGGGTGTVTTFSVTTANGVSAVVSNPTTTPAATFTLGAITPSTVNGNTLTAGTYTLTGAASKTLTFNNTLTLAGTDGTTITFPSTSGTVATLNATNIFSGINFFGTSGAVQVIFNGAASTGSSLSLAASRGSFASPTIITTGDILGIVQFAGYDGSGYTNGARISVQSTGAIAVGQVGSIMTLATMTTGGVLNTMLTLSAGVGLSFFSASAVVQQSVNTILVNNVTSGGSLSTIANYTDLSVYANDANAIRNNIFRLTEKVLKLETALRNYGLAVN